MLETKDKDYAWVLKKSKAYNLNLRDLSNDYAQVAIQRSKSVFNHRSIIRHKSI